MLAQFTPLNPLINSDQNIESKLYSKQRNWSQQELYKLACFLQYHSDKFQNQKIKKQSKIYAIMSKYINTRNSSQCRSFVVKLFSKFREFQDILRFFRESLPFLEIKYEREVQTLKKIIFPPKIAGQDMKVKNQYSKNRSFDQDFFQKTENDRKQVSKQLLPTNTTYYQQEKIDISILKEKNNISKPYQQQFYNFENNIFKEKQDEWKQCQRRLVKWIDKTINIVEKYKIKEIIL